MKRRNISIQKKRHHHKGSQVLLISLISLCLLFKADYTYAQFSKPGNGDTLINNIPEKIVINPADHFKIILETAKKKDANETNMIIFTKVKGTAEVDAYGITVGAFVEVKTEDKDDNNTLKQFYGGFIRGYGAEIVATTDVQTKNSWMDVSYTVKKDANVKENTPAIENKMFMKINPTGEISNVGYEFKIGSDKSPGNIKFNIIGEPSGKITYSGGVSYKTNIPIVSEPYIPGNASAKWEGSLNLSGDTQSNKIKLEGYSNFSFKPDGQDGTNYFFNISGSTIFTGGGNTDSGLLLAFGFAW